MHIKEYLAKINVQVGKPWYNIFLNT